MLSPACMQLMVHEVMIMVTASRYVLVCEHSTWAQQGNHGPWCISSRAAEVAARRLLCD
jgi:hypothetical protein